jgi:hypothetical protein
LTTARRNDSVQTPLMFRAVFNDWAERSGAHSAMPGALVVAVSSGQLDDVDKIAARLAVEPVEV